MARTRRYAASSPLRQVVYGGQRKLAAVPVGEWLTRRILRTFQRTGSSCDRPFAPVELSCSGSSPSQNRPRTSRRRPSLQLSCYGRCDNSFPPPLSGTPHLRWRNLLEPTRGSRLRGAPATPMPGTWPDIRLVNLRAAAVYSYTHLNATGQARSIQESDFPGHEDLLAPGETNSPYIRSTRRSLSKWSPASLQGHSRQNLPSGRAEHSTL
jgi:hypothetical protein